MSKVLLLLTVAFLQFSFGFSQNLDNIYKELRECRKEVDKQITKNLNKKKCRSKNDSIEIYHFFSLTLKMGPSVKDLTVQSFTSSLKPIFYIKKGLFRKSWHHFSYSYILDSKKDSIIGYAEDDRVLCVDQYNQYTSNYQSIIESVKDKQFEFFFTLANVSVVFAKLENDILVFDMTEEELKKYSLEEYISCCSENISSM